MDEMYLRFPGGRKKAFTISYDDNTTQDERLIELMKQYNIKGTFNIIPNWFAAEDAVFPEGETYINVTEKKALELYDNELIEVANHGFNHTKMTCTPKIQQMEDLVKCRQKLEQMYQQIITGFAYPYGWYNEDLMQLLKEAGITYARTVHSTYEFSLPDNWLELHPTCHQADERLPELTEHFLKDSVEEQPYMYYVWGHTFEFDQQNNWHLIEDLFQSVSGRDEIWYATNGELYDYHTAYQNLVFSADATRIYNPTATDLWVEIDRKHLIKLPAGSTTLIE